jgi:hypothetical protein
VAARQGAPVIGAICNAGQGGNEATGVGNSVSSSVSTTARWQLSFNYRWQDSYRHFVGDVEQPQRLEQQTQQENKIHLFDVGLSYQLNPRWSLSFSTPIMKADRINHRTGGVTSSTGIGDMSVGASMWIWRPPSESNQNIQVGMSLKLPTGNPNVTNTSPDGTVSSVDQSIQSGDSGVGFSVSATAYKSIQRFTAYTTAIYLFNPRNTYTPPNGVGRTLSVPDQYLLRGGIGYAVPKFRGLAFTFGGRDEGVPARDIIGREDGFRRPGYAVSIEPGVQFEHGQDMWSLSVGIAVHRDRTQSVQDVARGGHGDAAFADSIFLLGYSRSF